MSYDIDVYRAVVLARIPDKGIFRTTMARAFGRGALGLPPEHKGTAHIRIFLKALLLALYATHGDLTQLPHIEPWMGFVDGDSLSLPDEMMSALEDDLGYIATNESGRRGYFNLSALRDSAVPTDLDSRAAYYQIAAPERIAAICRAELTMFHRLTLHALFALGGRADIETMSDFTCMDVAWVVVSLRVLRRSDIVVYCEETGVFEINYELLKMVDMETEQ